VAVSVCDFDTRREIQFINSKKRESNISLIMVVTCTLVVIMGCHTLCVYTVARCLVKKLYNCVVHHVICSVKGSAINKQPILLAF